MKKRLLTLFMAVVMAASLCSVPASAFSDVADRTTATAVETLRLMGVLDGYGDGTFRPNTELNRAQFCKMVVYLMDGSDELGKYSVLTVFPDVKPSHWAASFVNLAAKGAHVISGYPDGKFHPERTVTAGQAVTILLRLLGYSDADIGGIWPTSQMAMGKSIGLTNGVGLTDGNRALTRGQAAKLFVNFLRTETKAGGTYHTLEEETTLLSVDGGAGTLTVSGSKSYPMVVARPTTSLVGTRGQVVLNSKGKALGFLPTSSGSAGVANGAVIIQEDGSSAGLNALAGGSSYSIYKNGMPASVSDLRKNDVAIWNEDNQTVRVCDTRVTVYYENCSPSPSAPVTIEALGGTQFPVLSTAVESLSKFKPGQIMTLLLTADGQVAGAVKGSGSSRGNAVGIVDGDGKVRLLCGTLQLALNTVAPEEYRGQVVEIASGEKGKMEFDALKGGVSGDLDTAAGKLGSRKLAQNVMLLADGKVLSLSELSSPQVRKSDILYARTNWNGDVDLIVLKGTETGKIYGRAVVTADPLDPDRRLIAVEYGNGQRTEAYSSGLTVSSGNYVSVKINSSNTGFIMLDKLTRLRDVSEKAWVGKGAVNYGGETYVVPETVLCYNADGGRWITLDAAFAYAGEMDLYVENGVVRVVEVKS